MTPWQHYTCCLHWLIAALMSKKCQIMSWSYRWHIFLKRFLFKICQPQFNSAIHLAILSSTSYVPVYRLTWSCRSARCTLTWPQSCPHWPRMLSSWKPRAWLAACWVKLQQRPEKKRQFSTQRASTCMKCSSTVMYVGSVTKTFLLRNSPCVYSLFLDLQ